VRKNIIIPHFASRKIRLNPEKIKRELKNIKFWDIHRTISFESPGRTNRSIPEEKFGDVNYMEFLRDFRGGCRIIALIGKWFPTGSHKWEPLSVVWFQAGEDNLNPTTTRQSGLTGNF